MSVAIVTCGQFPDLPPDEQRLIPALAERGVTAQSAVWSDPDIAWQDYELALIRSTWDCIDRMDEYLRWLERASNQTTLIPSADVVRWNIDKTYLEDLKRKGIPIVPSIWLPQGSDIPPLELLLREQGWEDAVVKPNVSNDGHGAFRVGKVGIETTETRLGLLLESQGGVIQEFLPSVVEVGERSVIFVKRQPTCTLWKRPASGEFRVQDIWGGTRGVAPKEDIDRELAQRVLEVAEVDVLCCRLDFLQDRAGQWVLSELEAVDASLFFELSPETLQRFADAIAARVSPRNRPHV